MPFRTPLSVRHEIGEEWSLLDPLVFEGSDDYFVMRKGFKTGRFGRSGPSAPMKVGQVAGMGTAGVVSVGVPTVVAVIGRIMLSPNSDKVVSDEALESLPTEVLASAY